MGIPHRPVDFSPTAITQAITVVYSISVHDPVVKLTVSTISVPCCGLGPRHCGVSLKVPVTLLNTRSVVSQKTGLFNVRSSAGTVLEMISKHTAVKKFLMYRLFKRFRNASASPVLYCAVLQHHVPLCV